MKNKVLVITGPTASGKSSIGIEIAKKLNGVVISADSMQIYKGLDVGTAKVTKEEQKIVKHELIDIAGITEKYSVSDYKKMCYKKIDEILKQGKVPIIVGGTGLYINAVVNNMSFDEETGDNEIENKIQELEEHKSNEELLKILKTMDSNIDEKIYLNNKRRILRAIKLNMLGQSKSSIDKKADLWHKNDSKYDFIVIYIDMPKEVLYDRINKRVDNMIACGILDESKNVYELSKKCNNLTAAQAIGYKEFFDYFENRKEIEECVTELKQKTRNYAKRQITWFKKLEPKIVIDGTKEKDKILEDILKEYYEEISYK